MVRIFDLTAMNISKTIKLPRLFTKINNIRYKPYKPHTVSLYIRWISSYVHMHM